MWQCNDWYMHLYTKKKLSLDLINDGLSVGWLVDSVVVHFSFQTLIMIIPPHSNWIKNWMYCEQWLLLNRYTAIESHRIDSKAFHFISVFFCVCTSECFWFFRQQYLALVVYSSGQHIIFFIVTVATLPLHCIVMIISSFQFFPFICCTACYSFVYLFLSIAYISMQSHIIIIGNGILSAYCTLVTSIFNLMK